MNIPCVTVHNETGAAVDFSLEIKNDGAIEITLKKAIPGMTEAQLDDLRTKFYNRYVPGGET